MSSNFLQRFKGKTQTISKDGVHNILGGGTANQVQVYTHSNGIPMNQKANTSKTSNMNPSKKNVQQPSKKNQSLQKFTTNNNQNDNRKVKILMNATQKQKQTAVQNPFLISNPFYLDEQQRIRQQKQKKQIQRMQKLQLEMKRAKQKQDPKKGTYSSSMAKKSNQTKKSQKQWVKLGGLGPNIGGEEWQQKRKKLQKMQQFAHQVKAINTQKNKIPKAVPLKKQEKKDDPRTKAIQYSKNVPKPVIKQYQPQQQQYDFEPIKQINQNQLSQLQMYELRHKELKQMLKKDF